MKLSNNPIQGLKVISANKMSEIEKDAFSQGVKEEDLMIEAGKKIAFSSFSFIEENNLSKEITLLIGKGNNGADAYVAGSLLLKKQCSVKAIHLFPFEECSSLNRLHCDKFRKEGGEVDFITSEKEISFNKNGIIIDGLLGTGFTGEISGVLQKIIELANNSDLPVISIDIPSGLNANSGIVKKSDAICATQTIFLSLPKVGFFLEDGWNYVGKLIYADIGLPKKYVDSVIPEYYLPNENNLFLSLPKMKRNRHKYEAGYLIGIAGSKGMGGAAKLSCLAALRSGAGMVRLLVSDENKEEMSNTPYEIIRTECREENIDEIYSLCEKAKALFVGPGLGRTKKVFSFLSKIFSKINTPLVIDADALFYLSENKNKIPPKSILTPHRKEMLRLLGWEELKNEKEFLIACKEFTEKFDVTLVLKGAPTFVFHPKSPTFILPYGDPGMATAGSGDVLTGIIAALLSQGVECFQAALLGVYLHGVAGEKAAVEKTSYSMISSDIIKQLQFAFKKMICGSSYL